MNIEKAEKRDKKRQKKNRMIIDNRSIFTIQETIIKKSKKNNKKEKSD
jgi:hypothetical protein